MKFIKNIFFNSPYLKKQKKIRRGFTLIEIMIVLVIIGTLITIFIFSPDDGNQEQIRLHNLTSRSQIQLGLQRFQQTCGRYPTVEEGISVLSGEVEPEGEDCPQKRYILNKNLLKDFYKNEYVYSISDDGDYQIISLGADKKEGGEGKNIDVNIKNLE